ncbi:hypothetical protein HOC35_01125 [Candidatus Woesearchaeota archaeon]|jgi:hypothetical protein|nr:hypothetical protein [Candidatus Woesearchaeota archaeon]
MAGNVQVQAKNVQVNLEQRVGNTTKLGGVGKLAELGNSIKRYATRVVLATALVASAGYVAGCLDNDDSECCDELKCESQGYGNEECYCTFSSPHKADNCVTNSDGEQECCSCECYNINY